MGVTVPLLGSRAIPGPCLLPLPHGPRWRSWAAAVATIAGAGLVATSGAIHLDLWSGTYRYIPTVGPLFLFQAVAAVAAAAVLLGWRRLIAAAVSVLLMAATACGYLISVNSGLFGFRDTLSAPLGVVSLAVEGAAILLLTAAGILARPWRGPTAQGRPRAPARSAQLR